MGEWNWVRIMTWNGHILSERIRETGALVPFTIKLLASPAILYHHSLGEFCGRPHSIHRYTKIPILIIKHHPKPHQTNISLKNAIKHLARMGSDACNMHRKITIKALKTSPFFAPMVSPCPTWAATAWDVWAHRLPFWTTSQESANGMWSHKPREICRNLCVWMVFTLPKNMSLIKEWRCWELHLRWRDASSCTAEFAQAKVVPKSCWSLPFNHQAMGQNWVPHSMANTKHVPSGKHTNSYWKWPSRNSGFTQL